MRKTWIFLKEKGLEFGHCQLDPLDKSPRFLAMNPAGRIPVLEVPDSHFVADSSVICDYLERVHPRPALFPAEHRARARALWLEEYADTAVSSLCAQIFWMHIIIPARSGKPPNKTEIEAFKTQRFPPVFDYLESVAPAGPAIVDDEFGIADIALAASLRLLELADDPMDPERWPRFSDYLNRTMIRPSAQSIVKQDLAALEVWRTTGSAPASPT